MGIKSFIDEPRTYRHRLSVDMLDRWTPENPYTDVPS